MEPNDQIGEKPTVIMSRWLNINPILTYIYAFWIVHQGFQFFYVRHHFTQEERRQLFTIPKTDAFAYALLGWKLLNEPSL